MFSRSAHRSIVAVRRPISACLASHTRAVGVIFVTCDHHRRLGPGADISGNLPFWDSNDYGRGAAVMLASTGGLADRWGAGVPHVSLLPRGSPDFVLITPGGV